MKKVVVILVLCFVTSFVFAEDRVAELQAEAQMLQSRLEEYQQIISNIQIRLIEIQGAIKELTKTEQKGKRK